MEMVHCNKVIFDLVPVVPWQIQVCEKKKGFQERFENTGKSSHPNIVNLFHK